MSFFNSLPFVRAVNASCLQDLKLTKNTFLFLSFSRAGYAPPVLALVLLFISSLSAMAQVSDEWMARYNGPGDDLDVAHAITLDEQGNVYVTGYSIGDETGPDYATVKYNTSGEEQWAVRYNGPGNREDIATSVGVDVEGNVYVTGRSWGDEQFDYATVKYNAYGEEQWVKRYDGPGDAHGGNHDKASALAVDGEGNIFVTGQSWANEGTVDYATIKYNTLGEVQWIGRYSGPANAQDEAKAIVLDQEGNVFVTGDSWGGETKYDVTTVKYNALGEEQWVTRYNSLNNGNDRVTSLAVDEHGNMFVAGSSETNNEDLNYTTVKYNASGEEQWAVNYNGPGNREDEAAGIGIDAEGNVYITGNSWGNGTAEDYATVKYNAVGEEQWVARYHNYGTDGDMAKDMTVDAEGNVYVTGQSWEDGGHFDYATIKYNTLGKEQWVVRYRSQEGSDYAKAIALDLDGNVFVTGYSWEYQDYVTVKYSQDVSAAPELTPPSELTAKGVSGSQINLSWKDNTEDEERFVLERATNPGFTGSVAHIRISANSISYQDKNKTTDVTFYYRIKAVRGEESSAYSEVVSAVASENAGNQAPVVDAGEDLAITLPTDSISFKAEASDPDGEISTYLWEQLSGPSATMRGKNTHTLSLTELVEGSFTFEVTVTDDKGAIATDKVILEVNAESQENIAPVADAGEDQTLMAGEDGTVAVTLDGSGSSDSDGSIVSYSWSTAGEEIATGVSATLSLAVGSHSISLTVTDNEGATDSDELSVTVQEADAELAAPSQLRAEGVSGDQIDVYWEDNSSGEDNFILERSTNANFTGSVAFISIPANTTSYEDRRKAADVTFYYRIKAVKGSDASPYSNIASGAAGYGAGNQLPVADAGEDQTLMAGEDGTVAVTLDGSGSSDSDGSIVSYSWSTAGEEIATGVSATLSLAVGSHSISLTVTDNEGATDSDELSVTVREADTELAAPSQLRAEGVSNSQINLSWENYASDHDGFVLERATNTDFTGSVAYIPITANSTSYEDGNKSADVTFYYRLKAVKGSISSDYSNIASAAASNTTASSMRLAGSADAGVKGLTGNGLQVYPNPMQQEFTLKLYNEYEGPVRLMLFDMTGRMFMEERFEKTSPDHTEELRLSSLSLSKGVYFLKVSGEGMDEQTIRLVKE